MEITGRVKKLIPHEKLLIMDTGTRIPVEDIVNANIISRQPGISVIKYDSTYFNAPFLHFPGLFQTYPPMMGLMHANTFLRKKSFYQHLV